MEIPRFTRAQVLEAFAALGLDTPEAEEVSSLQITGTEIELGLFVFDADGEPLVEHGEHAQVYVTVPVED